MVIAPDGPPYTAAQTDSVPSFSSIQTQGNPTEAYKATIPAHSFGPACGPPGHAKIYPWIGDASAVLDLAAYGFT